MPVLQVAIDATKAQTGAVQVEAATEKVRKGAKKAAEATEVLAVSVNTATAYQNKWIISLTNFEKSVGDSTRKIIEAAKAQENLGKGVTEATLVYENMNAAIKASETTLAGSAQESKKAEAAATGLAGAIHTVNEEVKKTPGDLSKYNQGWEKVGHTLKTTVNLLLGMSAGVAAVYAFKSVVGYITEFEKELAKLRGVVQGTDADMRSLVDAARYAGATTIFNATESAQGLLLLAQAGFSVGESIRALPATLTLATAGVISLDESASIVSNTINQFALSTREASRVSDIFVNTGNETNTTVLQLAEALEYTGPIAAAYGKSLDETSAALGVLSNRGIQASIAGTNLRGIFAALGGLTPKATKTIEDLGLTVEQVDPQLNSLTEIFSRFSAAGLTASQATEIFNRRNGSAALILAAAASEIEKLTQSNIRAGGIAQKNADLIENSLYGAFKKFVSIVQDAFLAVGQGGLVGGLTALANASTEVLKVLIGFDSALDNTTNGVYAMAATVKFLALSLTGLVSIKVASFLWSLIPPTLAGASAMTTLGAAVRGLWTALGPAGWLVVGIAAAVAAGEYFRNTMDEGADSLRGYRKEAEDLTVALENLDNVLAKGKFAKETQDIEGQISAMRRLQQLYETTNVDLTKLVLNGSGVVQIEDLKKLIQSAEGQQELSQTVRDYYQKFQDGGSFDFSKLQQSPYYGLSRQAEEYNKKAVAEMEDVSKRIPGSLSVPLKNAELYAIDASDAIRLLTNEMNRAGEKADELGTKFKELSAAELFSKQSAIVEEFVDKLIEEQQLVAMSSVARKGELAVREALEKAKEAEIDLTDDQIKSIRQEAEFTQMLTEAVTDLEKVKKDTTDEMEREKKNREDGILSIEQMIRASQSETVGLSLSTVEREKLTARLKVEEIARKSGITDIENYVEALEKEIDKQNELSESTARDKAIEELDKYVMKLEMEAYSLSLDTEEREKFIAVMRAEEIARDANVTGLDSYIQRILLAIKTTQELKDAEDKGKAQKKSAKEVTKLETNLSNERSLVGLTDDERERAEKMTDYQLALQGAYGLSNDELAKAIELSKMSEGAFDSQGTAVEKAAGKLQTYRTGLEELQDAQRLEQLADDIGSAFAGAFGEMITGAKNANEAMKDLYQMVVKLLLQEMFVSTISSALSGPLKSMMGVKAASGAVLSGGNVVPYASGGVVGSPEYFPMSGGRVGLVGEAGPEAILPLTRGKDGKLGVKSNGNGGKSVIVKMTVNTPNADSFRRSQAMITGGIRRALRSN